jgi:hypothetical protein
MVTPNWPNYQPIPSAFRRATEWLLGAVYSRIDRRLPQTTVVMVLFIIVGIASLRQSRPAVA